MCDALRATQGRLPFANVLEHRTEHLSGTSLIGGDEPGIGLKLISEDGRGLIGICCTTQVLDQSQVVDIHEI